MIYKIKTKTNSETTYFVNLNLVNNYNNTKLKKKNYNCFIKFFSSFYVILLYK